MNQNESNENCDQGKPQEVRNKYLLRYVLGGKERRKLIQAK
jgi:hypothetical protein